jgi:hypothetical protein
VAQPQGGMLAARRAEAIGSRGKASRRRASLSFPLQDFVVLKMYATTHHLYGSLFHQLVEGPGYRFPLGPDHGA